MSRFEDRDTTHGSLSWVYRVLFCSMRLLNIFLKKITSQHLMSSALRSSTVANWFSISIAYAYSLPYRAFSWSCFIALCDAGGLVLKLCRHLQTTRYTEIPLVSCVTYSLYACMQITWPWIILSLALLSWWFILVLFRLTGTSQACFALTSSSRGYRVCLVLKREGSWFVVSIGSRLKNCLSIRWRFCSDIAFALLSRGEVDRWLFVKFVCGISEYIMWAYCISHSVWHR
jgi:hypothetical protein